MNHGGRGWRHWYYATGLPGWTRYGYLPAWDYESYWRPMTEADEIAMLKSRAEVLQRELEAVAKRLEELQMELSAFTRGWYGPR